MWIMMWLTELEPISLRHLEFHDKNVYEYNYFFGHYL